MVPAAQDALDRLEKAKQGWWICSSVCNLFLMFVVSFSTLALFVLVDVLFQLPRSTLGILLVTWLAGSLAMVAYAAYRISRERRTLAGAARQVELAMPQARSHLINLIQLSNSDDGDPDSFRTAAIEEAASRIRNVPFHAAVSRQTRWSRWRLGLQLPRDLAEVTIASGLVLAVAIALHWVIPTWRSSADRLLTPWRYVPQTGAVEIVDVIPGDGDVLAGSRLLITAKIADPKGRQPDAVMYTLGDKDEKTSRQMLPNGRHDTFTLTIPSVVNSFRYQLQIGDSQSDVYQIGIRATPTIRDVEVTYRFPEYLALPEQLVRQKHADLDAPQYSLALVNFVSSTELSRGYVQMSDRQITGRVGEDTRSLIVPIPMNEESAFTVHLFNELGHTDSQPRVNNIRVSPDAPPTVQIAKPASETKLAPGGELSVVVRAADDHGLTRVRLESKADDVESDAPPELLHAWQGVSGSAATLHHKLILDSDRFGLAETMLIRAVAVDGRQFSVNGTALSPQQTASSWIRVTRISPQEQASETVARLEAVTTQLSEILRTQIGARIATAEISPTADLQDALRRATDIVSKQTRVQTRTSEMTEALGRAQGANDAEMMQVLGRLASGPMLQAVQQASTLAESSLARQLPTRADELMETQDEVITTLQRLLRQTRRTSTSVLADLAESASGDLAVAVERTLTELSNRLQQFIQQQRQVIDATKNLARKSVEDFPEEDKQLMPKLAAAENEWARLLRKTHSDLGELPGQDFANSSLLQEIVDIQSASKSAANALIEKSATIALPYEQLASELAEELLSKLDRLLPPTSDRDRWNQEEPLSDEMKEAPIAELPAKLEDMVGELMNQEEQLFEELQDVSKQMDKEMGVDPHGDVAVGDSDGKNMLESPAGTDGFEGPTLQQTQRALEMMAKRQADLRSRAETVDAKFRALNYQHADLRRMIDVMQSIESDLRGGRYQSALRRRVKVLDGLGSIKTYLGGEIEVRRDHTSNLPAEIQEKLLGSMLEASPAGWEELNRRYFQRLSGDDRPLADDAQ